VLAPSERGENGNLTRGAVNGADHDTLPEPWHRLLVVDDTAVKRAPHSYPIMPFGLEALRAEVEPWLADRQDELAADAR